MSPGLGLLLLASLSSGDPLSPAREAFARQDYASAEALALAVAAPPAEGAALYLAGLARFRAGRPAAALEALDRAALAADPPVRGLWDFNRAACLYDLARFAEAEEAFQEAARREPAVEAAALANAGFAAFDAGAPERARALAAEARAAAVTRGAAAATSLELVVELERLMEGQTAATVSPDSTATSTSTSPQAQAAAEHEAGLAAWDRGDAAEARRRFEGAAALDPSASRSLVMAGAAAGRQGQREVARATLARALAGPLDDADRRLALDHLDAASPGLASRGTGWEGVLRLGGGSDGNVLQSGTGAGERAPAGSGPVSSGLLSAGGSLAWRARLSPDLRLELAWRFDQVAYLSSAAEDTSLQQHLVGAALEWSAGRLRLGGSATAHLALAGRADFRVEQGGGGAGAWGAFDWNDRTSTRLGLEWTGRAAPAEFAYLEGDRLEADLSQALRLGPAQLGLGARARAERLGTLRQPTALPLPPFTCDFGCTQAYVIPFAYRSAALTLSAQAPLGGRLTLTLQGGYERRRYRDESFLQATRLDGDVLTFDRRLRRDERAFGAAAAGLKLGEHLSLSLRYDLLRSWSNVARRQQLGPGSGCGAPGFTCHALDYDDKNYLKQAVGVEAVLGF